MAVKNTPDPTTEDDVLVVMSLTEENPATDMTTEDDISVALAKAEAETERLRSRGEVIAQARVEARNAALVVFYRQVANDRAIEANRQRGALADTVEEIAAAPTLDIAALQAAFVEVKMADERCRAIGEVGVNLERYDPMPEAFNGADRRREPRSTATMRHVTWSQYFDHVIEKRATAEHAKCTAELNDAATRTAADAADSAAQLALNLPDGEFLTVERLPSLRELHAEAVEQIDTSTASEEEVRAGGLHMVERRAKEAELQKLIREGY